MGKESAEKLAGGCARCCCCGRAVRVQPRPRVYGMLRGVCLACRGSMRRLVARRMTTWDELVAKGLLLPAGKRPGTRQDIILRRLGRGPK